MSTVTKTKPEFNPQGQYGLALEQFDWGYPSEFETKWLTKRGVSFKGLMGYWPLRATNARFDGNGHFSIDAEGERVFTFVAFDAGVPIDVVAWQPRTGQTAAYLGAAAFLGDMDQVFSPATWFDGGDLFIHATPLEWLQQDRAGLVIVNYKLAGAYLRDVKSVCAPDIETAKRARKAINAACKPTVEIYTAASKRGKVAN